jgi:hypothetical protein
MRLIEIPDDGIVRIPIMRGEDSVGERRINLSHLPTIDAVPVVRCKDCVYWQDNNGGYPHEECRWGKNETPDADDFCSCGERKDGE